MAQGGSSCGWGVELSWRTGRHGLEVLSFKGEDGFGYDPLFYVPARGQTFAQLSPNEKNEISHRGIAMRAFCAAFTHVFSDILSNE